VLRVHARIIHKNNKFVNTGVLSKKISKQLHINVLLPCVCVGHVTETVVHTLSYTNTRNGSVCLNTASSSSSSISSVVVCRRRRRPRPHRRRRCRCCRRRRCRRRRRRFVPPPKVNFQLGRFVFQIVCFLYCFLFRIGFYFLKILYFQKIDFSHISFFSKNDFSTLDVSTLDFSKLAHGLHIQCKTAFYII